MKLRLGIIGSLILMILIIGCSGSSPSHPRYGSLVGVMTWQYKSGISFVVVGENISLRQGGTELKNIKYETYTNGQGNFEFSNVVPGDYIIFAVYIPGWGKWEIPITIEAGKQSTMALTYYNAEPLY